MTLDALMFATDTIESPLFAAIPPVETLPKGGLLTVANLEVSAFETEPVDITAEITDWTGHPINNAPMVKVAMDGDPMRLEDGAFMAEGSFVGRAQKLLLRAEYTLPTGTAFIEHEIQIADIGDPLDPRAPGIYDLRIPVYVPGSLRLTGSSAFVETALKDKTPLMEYEVGFQGGKPIDP